MTYSLRDVSDIWNVRLRPAGWAFSIWGLIYTLFGIFVLYQALPSDWIQYRSDEVIFVYMNLIFAINMIVNAGWLPFFQSNTLWGFIVSEVMILFLWATAISLMVIADRMDLWWVEVITMRLPFSVYAGWLTSATALNTAFMFKSWGMADEPTVVTTYDGTIIAEAWTWMDFMMFMSEEAWITCLLWFVFLVYEVIAWVERNPVYGLVFGWAGAAVVTYTATETP